MRLETMDMPPRGKSTLAAPLCVAGLAVALDYLLASPLVGAGYGVRGVLALCLAAAPLLSGRDEHVLPRWGRVRPSLLWLARFLGILLPAALLFTVLTILLCRAMGWKLNVFPLAIASLDSAPAFVFHGLVAAPIVEEFIYRGVIHGRLRQGMGPFLAVALAGPIFWVLHWLDRGGVSPPNHLLAGWILAWAFERTGSLLTPTLLHALGNGALLFLDLLWYRWPGLFE
ncbi:MAG TPA: CPBP family glutamic-type intramembrane protease [Planctomycetota bacterium]|nr:CPBP family glutamic-type intramembrane protease [Planctomycetota bacterium]